MVVNLFEPEINPLYASATPHPDPANEVTYNAWLDWNNMHDGCAFE